MPGESRHVTFFGSFEVRVCEWCPGVIAERIQILGFKVMSDPCTWKSLGAVRDRKALCPGPACFVILDVCVSQIMVCSCLEPEQSGVTVMEASPVTPHSFLSYSSHLKRPCQCNKPLCDHTCVCAAGPDYDAKRLQLHRAATCNPVLGGLGRISYHSAWWQLSECVRVVSLVFSLNVDCALLVSTTYPVHNV